MKISPLPLMGKIPPTELQFQCRLYFTMSIFVGRWFLNGSGTNRTECLYIKKTQRELLVVIKTTEIWRLSTKSMYVDRPAYVRAYM